MSTSSTDPGTLLIPTPARDAKTVVVEPDDRDGLPSIAVAQGGSGGHDGLTGPEEENEETSDEGQRSRVLLFHGKSTADHEGVDGSSVVSKSSLSVDEGRVSVQSEGFTHEKSSPSTDKDRVSVQSEGYTRFKRLLTKVAAKVEPEDTEKLAVLHDESAFSGFSESRIFPSYSLGPKDLHKNSTLCLHQISQ